MNSVPWAMTWELLRRGRWNFLAGLLGTTLVTSLAVGTLHNQGAWIPNDPSMILLHVVFMQLSMFIIGAVALQSADNPARLYAMPAKTSTIVTWQLLPSMAVVAILMLASTAAINAYFRLEWPLWGPSLFMAAIMAAVQAALWLTDKSAWLAVALAVVAGPLGIWFKSRYGRPFARPEHYWATITSGEIGFLLAVTTAAFVVANVAVARNRRGEPALSLGILAWFDRALQGGRANERPFRSAGHAQSWYEWRQKGYLMPMIVIVCMLGLFTIWSIFSRNLQELYAMFIVVAFALPMLGLAGALLVGNTGGRDGAYEMGPFLATRPMTTADMSQAILKTAARTVFAGWAIWLAGFMAFLATLVAANVQLPSTASPLNWQSVTGFLAFCSAILLATWIVVANGASIGLTGRQAIFVKVLAGVVATYFGALLGARYGLNQEGMLLFGNVVTILTGAAFVAVTVWAFVTSRRKKIVGVVTIYGSLGVFLALGLTATVVFLIENRSDFFPAFIFVIGLASLVVAPLATAPLALAWNRTR